MALTDTKVKNAKPGPKTIRLFDEKGLYLEVSPSGGKWWRFKYRFNGKEKRLSLGVYPDVTLKAARDRRDAARMSPRTEELIRRKRTEGMGILKIAKEVGVGTSVVQRVVKAA